MIYDGVLYFNNSPVTIPSTETVVTKNVKKKSRFNILKNYLSNSNPKSKFKIDIKLRMLLEKLMMKWKMHKKNLVSYFKIMKRTITNER